MKISIVDRLRAFSHNPGHEVMIPGTDLKVRVFPTRLECLDLYGVKKGFFSWDVKGPVFPFTVEQDLEKSCVRIYGESVKGYFRFLLKQEEDKIIVCIEKAPVENIDCKQDKIILVENVLVKKDHATERLFLGNTKQKDVDFMRRRRDLSEILPFWFFLGQMTPEVKEEPGEMMRLLDQISSRIENKDKSVDFFLLSAYLAGLSSGFVPRAQDEEFQGIVRVEKKEGLSAMSFLSMGSFLIRSLFFQEKMGVYHFLPCLPSKFPAGKMVGIKTSDGNIIDIEWTKHQMRRICIFPQKDGEIRFTFPFGIKRYRVRKNLKDRGSIRQIEETFVVKALEVLWLDRFQT